MRNDKPHQRKCVYVWWGVCVGGGGGGVVRSLGLEHNYSPDCKFFWGGGGGGGGGKF